MAQKVLAFLKTIKVYVFLAIVSKVILNSNSGKNNKSTH